MVILYKMNYEFSNIEQKQRERERKREREGEREKNESLLRIEVGGCGEDKNWFCTRLLGVVVAAARVVEKKHVLDIF